MDKNVFFCLHPSLAFPVGTAPLERSSSQLKLIKIRLRNRISDINLAKLTLYDTMKVDICVHLRRSDENGKGSSILSQMCVER